MSAAVLHGLLLSFGLILPLGVQNTFIFTQGALHRRWAGALPAVLTAAVCDTLLITLAVSGLSVVVLAAPWVTGVLKWVGVVFLLYMGWATWRTEPAVDQAAAEWPARRQVSFAASVSLLNPHAILDTVGVIGTNALAYAGASRLGFTLACIAVSWLWFLGLATAGYALGVVAAGGVTLRRWLGRISAVIMWAVALQLAFL